MPHDRDNKEWLHLRDAICLGNVRHIVDQLREEGILIPEADLALDLSIIKNKAGVDACGVVDKKTFHDSIVSLTQDWIGWGKKTGHSFLGGGIPDSVFEKMVGRASGRIKADPSHYTAETPQGALEGMEERLAAGLADTRGFAQQTMGQQLLLNEALAQMELKVGELGEAVRQMAAAGVSIPAPVIEAIEEVEQAVEEVEQAIEPALPTVAMPKRGKALLIANYLFSLGEGVATTDMPTFLAGINAAYPEFTFFASDYSQTLWRFPDLPKLAPPRRGGPTGPRRPRVQAEPPPAPAPSMPGERTAPRTLEELDPELQTIVAYMEKLGDQLGETSDEDIVRALTMGSERWRWPSTWPPPTVFQVRTAWNALRWINYYADPQKPRPPMLKDKDGGIEGGLRGAGNVRPDRMKALLPAAMDDPTGDIRRQLQQQINAAALEREELERIALAMGFEAKVWDTQELSADFDVQGFMAPLVLVTKKSDGQRGSLLFQHYPRYYWGFTPD